MAHYGIVCPDDAGGFLPIGSVGHELVRRGHRVTLLAGVRCAPLAEVVGLPFAPLDTDQVPRRRTPIVGTAFRAFGGGWMIGLRNWFRWYAEAIMQLLPAQLQALGIDGVLLHQNVMAGGTAAERAGIPYVTVCSSLPVREDRDAPPPFTGWGYATDSLTRWRNRLAHAAWRWFTRPMLRTINAQRAAWRLPRVAHVDELASPLAQLWQSCASFDFPRRDLPGQVHYIGSLGTGRPSTTDHHFPWGRLDDRPLVFASLGTTSLIARGDLLRRILAACAPLDVQLVLALGKWHDRHAMANVELGPLPANAVVVDFAPQLELLDRAAAMITHAGVNSVLEALCRGVPMVALPRGGDRPGMAARIAHAHVGLVDRVRGSSPEQLRRLLQRVLKEPEFRERACRMQRELVAAGGAARVAEIAEQALTTRRPVLR